MVLFRALPRGDVKPLAKALLKKFGSFAEVVHAPATRLREVEGVGEATITEFKLIAAAPQAASPRASCRRAPCCRRGMT
jgi:DNA repair protein RadC